MDSLLINCIKAGRIAPVEGNICQIVRADLVPAKRGFPAVSHHSPLGVGNGKSGVEDLILEK